MSILSSTQIPYSIGTATGIRVGNLLGAGEPEKAKKSATVSLFFASEYTTAVKCLIAPQLWLSCSDYCANFQGGLGLNTLSSHTTDLSCKCVVLP